MILAQLSTQISIVIRTVIDIRGRSGIVHVDVAKECLHFKITEIEDEGIVLEIDKRAGESVSHLYVESKHSLSRSDDTHARSALLLALLTV